MNEIFLMELRIKSSQLLESLPPQAQTKLKEEDTLFDYRETLLLNIALK